MLPTMDSLHDLFQGDAVDIAPELLGWTFATTFDGVPTAVRLVDVEAYMGADDPASHAYRGITPRTTPMFEAGGILYVYFVYGAHHCANIVTGRQGDAQAVLLRGGEPLAGVDTMVRRRGRRADLTNGPGNLARALGLSTEHSGIPIDGVLIQLTPGDAPPTITATPRIGISRATDRRWRFVAGA